MDRGRRDGPGPSERRAHVGGGPCHTGGPALRILVVEDNPHIAAVVGETLEEAGYSVTVAYDGEEGFLDARLNDYDLVILDLMLPTTDGLEVTRRLRAEGKAMPILMLTARDREQDTIVGLDARRRRLPDQAFPARRAAGPCPRAATTRGRDACTRAACGRP